MMNIKEIKQKFQGKTKQVLELLTTENAIELKALIARLKIEEEKINGIKSIAEKVKEPEIKRGLLSKAVLPEELIILKNILDD